MRRPVIVKTLKIAAWTLLAIVALIAVLLFCAVRFLDSKYLAPMVERVANDYIDGDVKVREVKLGFRPRFPIIGIEIEDLSIVSHAFDSLTPEQRGLLPNYSDSLLTLEHMHGSLDIKRLLADNELALHDVALRGLSVNIVLARNGKANYDMVSLSPDTASSAKKKIPGFRIDRFSLTQPKEIRFYNAADSTSASVLLLTDAAVDGGEQPTYRLKLNGNVTSPKATLLTNLDKISFGVNGKIYWNAAEPGLVAMDEMELQGAFIRAVVSAEIDFTATPVVRKGKVELKPVAVSDLLTVLPDSIRQEHGLFAPYFSTDAAISGQLELTQPMNLATDTLPTARFGISIAPAALNYGNAHLKDLALDVEGSSLTNLPDSIKVDIKRFSVAGPGTRLEATAALATLVSDPTFDVGIKGKMDFRDLPPIVLEKIHGYLAGLVSADLRAKGSVSMLKPERIHRLVADGTVTAGDVYFLTADTSKMVEVGNARIAFDSERMVDGLPLLGVKVEVDTATVLVSGIDLAFRSVELKAGMEASGGVQDSTSMMPVGADLKVADFNITSITDGAGARIDAISGPIRMRQLGSKGFFPYLTTDLLLGHVSAGTLSDRFLINGTKVHASLLKTDVKYNPPGVSAKKKRKSSVRREYSYISPAAVHKYVLDKRRHRKRTRRVYGEVGADDDEVLVWNLTPQFRKFLNTWKLQGTLNSNDAQMLIPVFPLKNRISKLALRFNNDTVDIADIMMRAGNSDIALSGQVTNVRRALTSTTDNTLKGNLSILSDTIDINQLSASLFTGAAYASDKRKGKVKIEAKDDKSLQARLEALSKAGPGKGAPVLIPVNIDANLRIEANTLLYSDVEMKDMGADLLVYDGGVSLHDLRASSEAGSLSLSALYTAPNAREMHFGFGMQLSDFNVAKFVKMVPAIDSITPLMHDFSGLVGAEVAATCRIDSGMNIDLPSLNAAIRITGDNLAFIDPEKYRTLGKWLGFKNKADNTIHSLNVEMTVEDGQLRVYPFVFDIDRYRLGVYGYNDMAMNFDYHLSVLKSPIPFKFGITVSGNPKKYKVRFGGAKFSESTVVRDESVANKARINLMDQIQGVFKRGVRNSRFAKLQVARLPGFEDMYGSDLSAADSLRLIKEGLLEAPAADRQEAKPEKKPKKLWKVFQFFVDLWHKLHL